MDIIYQLILALGIKRTYKGYYHLATAIQLVLDNEDRLLYINKWLYNDVAKLHDTTSFCIERNIRTVNFYCWNKGNRKLLCKLAGYHLDSKPSNAELIDIIAQFIKYNAIDQTS